MKNSYSKQLQMLKQRYNDGVYDGFQLMCLIFLIAEDNVAKVMFADRTVKKLLKDTETEAQRIYDEVMASVKTGEQKDMAEILEYYSEEIRKRREMDEGQT